VVAPVDFATTIPSRELEVWRRLYERYSLEPGPASVSPDVSKTIMPITNADELLQRPRGVVGGNTPGADGGITIATVPQGIRWRLQSLVVRRASGVFDFDRVILQDVVNNLDVIVDIFADETNFRVVPSLTGTPIMNPGDLIRTNITNFVSTGTINSHVWIVEETFF